MTQAILAAAKTPVSTIMDKWVLEGNEVTKAEVSITMLHLRKRRMFMKALQLYEWLEKTEQLEFSELDYALRTDLIAKACGDFKAKEYIQSIPESFRSEIVYRSLLANAVLARNAKKAEQAFNKMKILFPLSCFSCEQMLLLYKRTNRKKIGDILLLMEKENIKPSIPVYQILIDVKGQSGDVSGVEQILEAMKSNGVEPNTHIQASVGRCYAAAGLKDKAEAVLKQMEGDDIEQNRFARQLVLPIYATLGREDEVRRIWKACESNPRLAECISAIEAWGKLERIEEAEAIFEKMLKIVTKPSQFHYQFLLNVYIKHNLLAKGKDLVARMAKAGGTQGLGVWDALVKLYTRAGEVEMAYSILQKRKPLVTSYLTLLNHYAVRGDVHNAEKIFLKMRGVGYPVRLSSYRSLIHAYINAKTPAYGFPERLKGDNIIPDEGFARLFAQADPFRKRT